ncbi:MAG: M81 family metallopeptidase [Pseudomonadota bacterium]
MRVFTAALATETNTFGPMPTGMQSFRDRSYFKAGTHPAHMTYLAGAVWAALLRAKESGWDVVQGLVAASQPSGTVTRATYELLRDELLQDLRNALPVDMVALGLHGAMVADGYDDCEGDLLAHVRAIVGPDVVVGATLDLHGNLSAAMVANADLLVSYKEYPHTDMLERANELLDLCAAKVEGRIRITPAVVDCEMFVTMFTTREPARSFVDRLMAMEGQGGVLSISVMHGFAWGDVPDMGTKVLVYTDGDASKAASVARRLADQLVAMRDELTVTYPDIDSALDQALAFAETPVLMADGADNPGGGAAGDATFILQRVLARGIGNVAMGPFWDPIAVRIAMDAGVGTSLSLRVGGKVGPLSGSPVDLQCSVKAIVRDMVMTGLSKARIPMGDSVLIEANGVELVLISLRMQAVGTDLFTQFGCDLAKKRLIVVKSSQHFHAAFSKYGKHVIYAGAPGSVTLNIQTLPYRKINYPKWPLLPAGGV